MAERDTLAAFAVQLDELRAKVATLEQEGPGKMMVVLAQVKKLSDALNRALGKNKTLIPQAPYWPAGSGSDDDGEFGRLRDWVDDFLRPQHPGYPVPACWPAHKEAVWELANLFAEWVRVYGDPDNQPLDGALWFYERWLPGVRSRLFGPNGSMSGCKVSCVLQLAQQRANTERPRYR